MIIKDVALNHRDGRVALSAKCKIRKVGWDRVYFSAPLELADYVVADASPFAAALLIPSMRQGEDLIIHGSISAKLYEGMQQIMQEVQRWDLGLKLINIKVDSLREDLVTPTKTASFFSGGVDSFYTYLKHKTDSNPKARVGSLILARGFDIDIADEKLWQRTITNISAIARAEQVELVTVESNIYDMLEPLLMSYFQPWDYTHGGCLAAVGLFLRAAFRQIYVPATFTTEEDVPWGSNPVTDVLWSTERLRFVHDGVEATRLEKILHVVKSPVALKQLRVCYVNSNEAYNCGVCSKCLRTMTGLYIAGALEQAEMFPSELDIARIAATPAISISDDNIFPGEQQNLDALRERNLNPELQRAVKSSMDVAIKRGRPSASVRHHVVRRVLYYDYAYAGGYGFRGLTRIFGKRYF